MKSLITGGAGFLGCHLAEYLVKLNHKVIIIDNFSTGRLANLEKIKRKVKIVKSDISKDGSWKKNFNDVDWVFHFASLADIVPSIENPKNYFSSNDAFCCQVPLTKHPENLRRDNSVASKIFRKFWRTCRDSNPESQRP